jgi:hypothetical protein
MILVSMWSESASDEGWLSGDQKAGDYGSLLRNIRNPCRYITRTQF